VSRGDGADAPVRADAAERARAEVREAASSGAVHADRPRGAVRVGLAVVLLVAGVGHFVALEEFRALVPPALPARDAIVWGSGVMEIAVGLALLGPRRWHRAAGWAAAALLVAVFPGNVYQALARVDAGPLDTDVARWARLPVQPLLIAAALWSSGVLRGRRPRGRT
jgi:uncharacterized membrane protein